MFDELQLCYRAEGCKSIGHECSTVYGKLGFVLVRLADGYKKNQRFKEIPSISHNLPSF